MGRNNDPTTGNLLDYGVFFLEHYRLVAIDLSNQIELQNPSRQQISFIDLIEMREPQYSLSLKNQKKQLLNFNKLLWP